MDKGKLVAGRYELGRKIARGSTADLFEATTVERRVVVMKLLRDGLPDADELVTRFRREAEVVASLNHPNIVRVLDSGTAEGGRPFLVMEHLVGQDLARELKKRGHIPLAEAAKILADVCHAVEAAHVRGVVHRDLKPSNVFLSRQGKVVRPVVLDFGIAGLLGASDQRITQTQSLFGSPLYMAPEAFKSAKLVDARSDVWSLGVMFYEMLTGVPPFSADTPVAVGLSVMREDFVLPSSRRPELGRAVDVVMGRVLKKEPAERYQTVRELLAAIEVFLPTGRNDTMAIPAIAARVSDDDDDVPTRLRPGEEPLDAPTRARPDITAQILAATRGRPADEENEAPTKVRDAPVGNLPPRPGAMRPGVAAPGLAMLEPETSDATVVDPVPAALAVPSAGPPSAGPTSAGPTSSGPPSAGPTSSGPTRPPAPGSDAAPVRGPEPTVALPDTAGAPGFPAAPEDTQGSDGLIEPSNPNQESSRFASPVSVTNRDLEPLPTTPRSKLLWIVPAVAAAFGLGGYLMGRTPSEAPRAPAAGQVTAAATSPASVAAPVTTAAPKPVESADPAPTEPAPGASLSATSEPAAAAAPSDVATATAPARPAATGPRKPPKPGGGRFTPTKI